MSFYQCVGIIPFALANAEQLNYVAAYNNSPKNIVTWQSFCMSSSAALRLQTVCVVINDVFHYFGFPLNQSLQTCFNIAASVPTSDACNDQYIYLMWRTHHTSVNAVHFTPDLICNTNNTQTVLVFSASRIDVLMQIMQTANFQWQNPTFNNMLQLLHETAHASRSFALRVQHDSVQNM